MRHVPLSVEGRGVIETIVEDSNQFSVEYDTTLIDSFVKHSGHANISGIKKSRPISTKANSIWLNPSSNELRRIWPENFDHIMKAHRIENFQRSDMVENDVSFVVPVQLQQYKTSTISITDNISLSNVNGKDEMKASTVPASRKTGCQWSNPGRNSNFENRSFETDSLGYGSGRSSRTQAENQKSSCLIM